MSRRSLQDGDRRRGSRRDTDMLPTLGDDLVPPEVPALVVRLESRVPPILESHWRIRASPVARRVPVDRRGAGSAPRDGLSGCRERPEPLAAARQVAALDTALGRAVLSLDSPPSLWRSSPGLRFSSPESTRAVSSTSSSASCAGRTVWSAIWGRSSPTSIRPSRCGSGAGRWISSIFRARYS